MIAKFLCHLLLFGLMLSCSAGERSQPRVGGPVGISGSDPINRYTVIIRFPGKGSYCSGTLLSPSYVLLAAHCIENTWRAKVLVGYDKKIILADGRMFSAVGEGESYAASKHYFTHRFRSYFTWIKFAFQRAKRAKFKSKDIALIKLVQPLDLPYGIDYKIPPPDTDLTGRMVTIAGYGIGDVGQQPGRARKAVVKVAKDYQDGDLLGFFGFSRKVNFGDSGGPVWWKDDSGDLNLIGVHALVDIHSYHSVDIRHHHQWLKDAVRVLQAQGALRSTKLDVIKEYFPGYLEDFHAAHSHAGTDTEADTRLPLVVP